MNLTGYFKGKNNAGETEHGTDPFYYISETTVKTMHWRIQNFPDGGRGRNSKWGGVTYNLAIFPRKRHENENNLPDKKARPCDPPLHWPW